MTLGERICQYRVQRRLSQQEVAEKLEVSRQSVSKWETDGAVPELDKLVKLCELFEVSLDELVQGKPPEPKESTAEPPPHPEVRIVREKTPVRLIVGGVLLSVGLLGSLILFVLAGPNGILPLPIALAGVICLVFRRNTGLICCWVIFALAAWYVHFATGILLIFPFSIFTIVQLLTKGGYPYNAFGWIGLAEYIIFYVLMIVTLYRLVKFFRE